MAHVNEPSPRRHIARGFLRGLRFGLMLPVTIFAIGMAVFPMGMALLAIGVLLLMMGPQP